LLPGLKYLNGTRFATKISNNKISEWHKICGTLFAMLQLRLSLNGTRFA